MYYPKDRESDLIKAINSSWGEFSHMIITSEGYHEQKALRLERELKQWKWHCLLLSILYFMSMMVWIWGK